MIMMRYVELIIFFIVIPLVLVIYLPPKAMYPVLSISTLLGLILLHFTKGFLWRNLLGKIHFVPVISLSLITFIFSSLLCWIILPERLWSIILTAPYMLIAIAILYPLLLVVPQELIYRVLFFERYGNLFKNQSHAVFVNAVLFSFAHLMYWHIVVWLATFIGSFIFSYAYLKPRGFVQTCALHSLAGVAIFASGLGWLFFSGGNLAQ